MKSFVVWNKNVCEKLVAKFPNFFRSEGGHKVVLKEKLLRIIETTRPKTVLDVGAANRPILGRSPEYVFSGLDIEQLENCRDLYDEFFVQSIEESIPDKQDLIYSNAVLEHVPNNTAAVNSIYGGLNPGGTTAHYVPCKNHPYALILRAVGKKLQKVIIRKLRPWSDPNVTGYPTYFDHCSPKQMTRLFENAGFGNIEIFTFYRANSYFKFFFPLFILVTGFENLCQILNWRMFCSGMIISATRG